MRLVLLSGKGGTGKTTLATAFSHLAEDVFRVDCDVDAPNFYLYYKGEGLEEEPFTGGQIATVDRDQCTQCGACDVTCQFDAIHKGVVDVHACEGCGACRFTCKADAISLVSETTAKVHVSKVADNHMVSAEMEIGSEGSGKLITRLKEKALDYNVDNKLIMLDGSPGIGCPVMASITGSDVAVIVTEPTKSGKEDLIRLLELCQHFRIPSKLVINKADINEEMADEIKDMASQLGADLIGQIPYDETVMTAINALKPITSYKESSANKAIRQIWKELQTDIKR